LVTGTPDVADGTTFVVNEPACFQFDVVVHYLDGTEAPLPLGRGGILACPAGGAQCASGSVDANGHVVTGLDPNVTYTTFGYAINMDGWACGFPIGSDLWWFSSNQVVGTPATANGTTFVIYQPNPSTCPG
jgi:hypothetical protein